MPSCLHDDVDGTPLPVGVDDVTAGQVVEILAVVRVGPQAHRAVGKGALTSVDIFFRKHIIMWFLCKDTKKFMRKLRISKEIIKLLSFLDKGKAWGTVANYLEFRYFCEDHVIDSPLKEGWNVCLTI